MEEEHRRIIMFQDGMIVKYKGELGRLILGTSDKTHGMFLFYPVTDDSKYEDELTAVTLNEVEDTLVEEKVEYLKQCFHWGAVEHIYNINDGEYVIFRYHSTICDSTTSYHPYLNLKDTNHSYSSLDSAIIGLLEHKYQGLNSQAGTMFKRMLQMEVK